MTVKALVVDDSAFFRRRIIELLNSDDDIEVIGSAANGQEAVKMTTALKPDVITMDIEMPIMDGITATREIMSTNPTPILMFSSFTFDGAKATLEALEAGAMDYLPKRFEDIAGNKKQAVLEFKNIVKRLACKRTVKVTAHAKPSSVSRVRSQRLENKSPLKTSKSVRKANSKYAILAIGASTGGPVALQKMLTLLPANFPVPIVVIQHMPAAFTPTFAERLNQLSKLRVKQAEHDETLKAGTIYIAPGGMQMLLKKKSDNFTVVITKSKPGILFKPCVDITFQSLAISCRSDVMSIILTGMGSDGCKGAADLKQKGATVWAQNEESCVVYGMPAAIVDAGLADEVLSIDDLGTSLCKVF